MCVRGSVSECMCIWVGVRACVWVFEFGCERKDKENRQKSHFDEDKLHKLFCFIKL